MLHIGSFAESCLGLDPRRFGAHSLRIGGATAGLAGKLSEQILRAAGRWSSDAAELYARASKEAMMSVALIVGSTPFEDVERNAFLDEDLMVTTASHHRVPRGGAWLLRRFHRRGAHRRRARGRGLDLR